MEGPTGSPISCFSGAGLAVDLRRPSSGSRLLITPTFALGAVQAGDEDARQRIVAAPGRPVEDRLRHHVRALAQDEGVQGIAGQLRVTAVDADDQARRAIAVPDATHVAGAD